MIIYLLTIMFLGNYKTLSSAPDLRERLLEYHEKFYSANIMKLSILGRGIYYTYLNDNNDIIKMKIMKK